MICGFILHICCCNISVSITAVVKWMVGKAQSEIDAGRRMVSGTFVMLIVLVRSIC